MNTFLSKVGRPLRRARGGWVEGGANGGERSPRPTTNFGFMLRERVRIREQERFEQAIASGVGAPGDNMPTAEKTIPR